MGTFFMLTKLVVVALVATLLIVCVAYVTDFFHTRRERNAIVIVCAVVAGTIFVLAPLHCALKVVMVTLCVLGARLFMYTAKTQERD